MANNKDNKNVIQNTLSTILLPKEEGNSPNFDGYVVIGAGLPRTGTLSMKTALEKLLNGPCYHMRQVLDGGVEDEVINS